MGLHSRFPSFFYKRGNLFNTYLGYTDGQTSASPTGEPRKVARRKAPPHARTPEPRKTAPRAPLSQASVVAGARLGRFARDHLTLAETEQLLRLIAARAGVRVEWNAKLDARLPLALGQFVAEHVPPDEAARYLTVLEQRLSRGEPLVQKK